MSLEGPPLVFSAAFNPFLFLLLYFFMSTTTMVSFYFIKERGKKRLSACFFLLSAFLSQEDGEYVVCGVVVCGPCLARRPSICRGSVSSLEPTTDRREKDPSFSLSFQCKKGLSLSLSTSSECVKRRRRRRQKKT